MSEPLWQKTGIRIDATVMRFLAGTDVVLDREFLRYDIRASRAHAEGLHRIGLLQAGELAGILRELETLDAAFVAGTFALDDRHEDGHSAIEAWLTERLGDVGRKIHTGRSRNDQILVATRLWLKDRLAALADLCTEIARMALSGAAEHDRTPMPGYTHLQRAVVSTVGHWYAGYAEAFIDNGERAASTYTWIDANPLGTAAGYGVNLALDRDYTTQALGFDRLQVNPAYAQLSRGKFELAGIEALGSAMLDLRRLAWDLSLFTTTEYGFVALPAQYTTGSSIMPNKRNPDVVELMRASYAPIAAARVEIEQLLSLPSGYQRDLQLSKGSLVHAFGHGLDALTLLPTLLGGLHWNESRMLACIDDGMHATDRAVELALAGVPFRDAYRRVADQRRDAPESGSGRTAASSIEARVSPGACGALQLDRLRTRSDALRRFQGRSG